MALNYVLPTNLVLEMIILSGHSYGLGNSETTASWQKGVDETCAGIISIFLILNALWIIYFRGKGRQFSTKCLALRAFQGGIILVVGVMLIVVAMSLRKGTCQPESTSCNFETRIVIAVLVILDAVFYFLPPLRQTNSIRPNSVMQPGPRGVYPQGEHPQHLYYIEPPPSYFQVHNNHVVDSNYSYNAAPPPPYQSLVSTTSSSDYLVNQNYNISIISENPNYSSDDNNNVQVAANPSTREQQQQPQEQNINHRAVIGE